MGRLIEKALLQLPAKPREVFLQRQHGELRFKKIAEFERQSRELAGSYSKAQDEAARKTLRANLAEIVTKLFDLREQNRQEEVRRMETDLKRLKDTLAPRQKNRANIIERRIQQLTGEAGAMEWE